MSEKTTLRKQIDEFCDENWPDEDILLFGDQDGGHYDVGFLGVGYQQHKGPIAIYDREKCIDSLAEEFAADDTGIYEGDEDADPYTDALEWFSFNTEGSWVGESTPIIVSRFDR
tara:strand:+ start:102 stop:443 length:342 start_codon:yes stop_codon:yes gene_type:complete